MRLCDVPGGVLTACTNFWVELGLGSGPGPGIGPRSLRTGAVTVGRGDCERGSSELVHDWTQLCEGCSSVNAGRSAASGDLQDLGLVRK